MSVRKTSNSQGKAIFYPGSLILVYYIKLYTNVRGIGLLVSDTKVFKGFPIWVYVKLNNPGGTLLTPGL